MGASEREAVEEVLGQVGANLQALRQRRGLTQAELAEQAAVDPTHIRSIEGGRRAPSLRLLVRLSRLLEVQVRDFFRAAKRVARNPGRPRKKA